MSLRRALVLLCLAAWALPLAPAAHAGEGDDRPSPGAAKRAAVDHVAQLTAEELAFLRSRIREWDALDAHKKQVIARNVLRIRGLKPEQRKAFQKKLGHLRGRDRSEGRRRFHDHATTILVNRALAQEARKSLGRAFDEQLQRKDISQHAFEMAFSMTFWRQVAENMAAAGSPPAPTALPQDASERHRVRYAAAYAEYAKQADTPRGKVLARRLWFSLAMVKGEDFRRRLQQTDLKGDAYVAAVGAAARREWGEVFEGTLAQPEALLEAAERVEVKRSLRRLIKRSGRLDHEESALLVALLGRLAGENLKGDPAAADVDGVLKTVLMREFKLSADDVAKLPPADDIDARAAFVQRLFRSRMGGLGRGFGPPGRGDGRADGRGRRPLAALERPDGVSDADWTAFQAVLGDGRGGGGRSFLRARPDGMTAEGYRILREALQKRFGARRRK